MKLGEGNRVFLILSLKWSVGVGALRWWGPNNTGYSIGLSSAGRYTEDKIAGNPSYYNDGRTTLAVPADIAESFAEMIVSSSQWESLERAACEATGTSKPRGIEGETSATLSEPETGETRED